MQLTLEPWRARLVRRMPRRFPYAWTEAALLVVLAVQCARLVWLAFAPLGPIGAWKSAPSLSPTNGAGILKSFDPFFRMSATSGATVVTSLPLKLFGVRVDTATGRGSAIIAAADGVQQSFAVGDEIMPGIHLKSVAQDSVTIDRSGVAEQLFLDQSVPAPVAQPAASPEVTAHNGALGGPLSPVGVSPVVDLRSGVAFAPRIQGGAMSGFVVAPKGAGNAFRGAGFQLGDVVTAINGTRLESAEGASAALAGIPPGAPIGFTVERGGRVITFTAKGTQ